MANNLANRQDWAIVEAELRLPVARLQIVQLDIPTPVDAVLQEDDCYRLDFSLTPRLPGSKFSFSNHWSSNRFESAGKLFLLPPGEPLRVRSGAGQQGALICHLLTEPLRQWFDGGFEWTDQHLNASLNIGNVAIGQVLHQLKEEMIRPGFASRILSEALAVQLTVNLQRYYLGIGEQTPPGGLSGWRLRLIDERLAGGNEAPTLSELAALCNLSVRQLSRGFRLSRGMSIGEYVAERRVDNAKRLLAAGDSIKAVAYGMGFGSPSSFCYAFKKSTGQTPGQYQQQVATKRYFI